MLNRTLSLAWLSLFLSFGLLASAQFNAIGSSPATVVMSTSGVSNGVSWNNLSNIQASNNAFATAFIQGSNRATNNIDATGWGFQSTNSSAAGYVPPTANINGIEVSIRFKKSLFGTVKDNKIMLLKGGAEAGANKARSTATWPSTAAYVTFGSSTDVWGTTFTVADITNAGFGVRISAKQKGKKDVQAEIDHVRITVYFNQKFFYSKSSGNLETTTTWGSSVDGSGTAPLNFTNDGQVFYLRNRSTASLTNSLTISGAYSKMVIGDGTNATSLTVPAAFALTSNVDVAAGSSITITNTASPTLKSIATNTTVTYNAAGDQVLSDAAYFNLTLGGSGNKLITQNVSALTPINNVLTINSGAVLNNRGNNVEVTGTSNGIINNGLATGTGKYIYSLLDVNTGISGTGTYSNLEIDASTSTNTTRSVSLANATTITGSLILNDGTFSNGTNLTMAAGSLVNLMDGSLSNSLAGSTGYDVVYSTFNGTAKTTSFELGGSVRDLTMQIASGATLSLNNNLSVSRNLTLSSGSFDPTTNNYSLAVGGNFTNNATLVARNNTVLFNGAAAQLIAGTAAQSFYNLTISNSNSGSVQLNTPVTVRNALSLNSGIVFTSATNKLTISAQATLNGGSNNSYINGPLVHTLASLSGTKNFPIGRDGAYRPVSLNLNQTNTAATTYTGEVISGAAPSRTLPMDIESLSSVRYYRFTPGSSENLSSATINLTYGSDEALADPLLMRIVKSNGVNWENIGGTGSASGSGTITSGSFYAFSDFVIAKGKNVVVPLTWISFTGIRKGNGVVLGWRTAEEVNTSFFSLEKSQDGKTWVSFAKVNSDGGVQNTYQALDMAPAAKTYYRIKQVDKDGLFSYSKIILVQSEEASGRAIQIQPNPITGSTFNCIISNNEILSAKEVVIKIFDLGGRMVFSLKTAPAAYLQVPGQLAPGAYVVLIQGGNTSEQVKVLVR